MTLIRLPAEWLLSITGHFPAAVQPGVFAVIVLLLSWLLVRRRRSVWNRAVRYGSLIVDWLLGLVLLPEYAWTSARRASGRPPAELALTVGPVAERALDGAARAYEHHGPVATSGRPPLVWPAIFIGLSLLVHWLMMRTSSGGLSVFAGHLWGYWSSFGNWARGA